MSFCWSSECKEEFERFGEEIELFALAPHSQSLAAVLALLELLVKVQKLGKSRKFSSQKFTEVHQVCEVAIASSKARRKLDVDLANV